MVFFFWVSSVLFASVVAAYLNIWEQIKKRVIVSVQYFRNTKHFWLYPTTLYAPNIFTIGWNPVLYVLVWLYADNTFQLLLLMDTMTLQCYSTTKRLECSVADILLRHPIIYWWGVDMESRFLQTTLQLVLDWKILQDKGATAFVSFGVSKPQNCHREEV